MQKPRLWLLFYRKKSGKTHQEVAEEAGISRPYYSQIENGKRKPSVKTAKAIALTLGFSWTKFYEK